MASRKHHKQDATRPTKARERRIKEHLASMTFEDVLEESREVTGATTGQTGAP